MQTIGLMSAPTSLNLELATVVITASIQAEIGVAPELVEDITMDGVAAKLLTLHYVNEGISVYELDAFTVNNGRVFEIAFGNVAGTESVDRAFMLNLLSTFKFMAGP